MKQLSLFEQQNSADTKDSSSGKNCWKLFVDGASRNNPGPSGAGFFILKNDVPFIKKGFFLGTKTNNQAEYFAMILGLFFLKKELKSSDLVLVVSDSQLLIRQFHGIYKVKHPELLQLHTFAKNMMQGMNVEFMHVLREQNKVADEYANRGIDKKEVVPQDFLVLLKNHAIPF